MRKQLLAAGMLLALTACAAPKTAQLPTSIPTPPPVAVATPTPATERPGYVDHLVTVGEDEYTVRMVGTPGQYIMNDNAMVLTRIEIYQNADLSMPVQVLDGFTDMADSSMPMDGAFLVQDVNFDDWTDFCFETLDYRGNLHLAEMLWDPETGAFGLGESEMELTNPIYDAGTRLVYGTFYSGLWGYTQTVCRREGDGLVKLFQFRVGVEGDGDAYRAVNRFLVFTEGDEARTLEWWEDDAELSAQWLLPGAEPYAALTRPLEEIESPTDGEYAVWRLVYMGPGRPVYAARLTSDYIDEGPGVRHNSLRQIDFYALGNLETPLQTIPLEGGDSGMFPPGTGFGFKMEDLNFDGWPDLRFFHLLGTVNAVDYCILYDPASTVFARNEKLEGICFLEADPKKQVLRGWARGGWGMYYDEIYRWIGGEPTLIRQVYSYPPEEGMETDSNYTVSDYVDGALVVVKEYKNVNWEQTEARAELERWETDPDYHGEGAE